MTGYIVLFLMMVSCSLQGMYDSTKRLKISDSTESPTYTPLHDVVTQSQVYQAFHEDTGASEQECLDMLTTPAEQVLLNAYAIQKQKDPSSLVARSYKALGVAQFATLANVANKLDIPKAYHEILDDLGQKIHDLTEKKQYQQIDQLQSLDTDARGELGKRMSLDLLAHLKIVSFSPGRMRSTQNVIESSPWYMLIKYNNYFPIKKKILKFDSKKILDCTISADSKSIIALVKNKNNNMQTLLIDSATGKGKSLKEEKYRSNYDVVASPNGVSHIYYNKQKKVIDDETESQSESEDSEDSMIDLKPVCEDATEGMTLSRDWSMFAPNGNQYFEFYQTSTDENNEDDEGSFTVIAIDKKDSVRSIFSKEKFRYYIKQQVVSTLGRFSAVSTFVPFDLEEQLGDIGCIYLYDSHTHKKHIIHGKNTCEDFRVQNISFDDQESIMIVTTDSELFVLDCTQPLPEIIDLKQHAAEHHDIIQDYDYENSHQTQPFITQWRVDKTHNTAVGLFKNNEYLLTLAQKFKTKDEVKNMPHRELCHDDTHIELADMSPAYDYIKTITSMTPEQAALVMSLIKRNQIIKKKNAHTAVYLIELNKKPKKIKSPVKEAIALCQQELAIYNSLHEDIKRHLLKTVKIVGITDQADDTSD